MADGADVQGMVNDQRFLALPPAQQRQALQKLTGDDRFSNLSDGDTLQFTSRLRTSALPEMMASHTPQPQRGDINWRDPRPLSQRLTSGPMPGSFEGHPENLAGYVRQSAGEVVGGISDIAEDDIARGAHRVISGVGTGMTPFVPFVAAAAPAATARAIAGGVVGGKIASTGAEMLGANPDQSALVGDVGAIVGGGAGVKSDQLVPKAKALGSTLVDELISRIPVAGRVVRRPSFADYYQALRAKGVPASEAASTADELIKLKPEDIDKFNEAAGIREGANVPTRDVIAANPGEQARLAAVGTRMTQPAILPTENRGLALPAAPEAAESQPVAAATSGPSTVPRTLAGEGILNEALTSLDNKTLLTVAKSRGLNVTQEAQLKPGVANTRLVKKIIDSFSDEELDNARNIGIETERFGPARIEGLTPDQAREVWHTRVLNTFFPDVKISQAQLGRVSKAMDAIEEFRSLRAAQTAR
jgi:hypothetical protein